MLSMCVCPDSHEKMPNNRSVWICHLRCCNWPPSPPLSSTSTYNKYQNTKKKIAVMNSRSRRASPLMRFYFKSVYWIDARLRLSHSSDTMQMTQSKFEMRWRWWGPEQGNYYSCSYCSRFSRCSLCSHQLSTFFTQLIKCVRARISELT